MEVCFSPILNMYFFVGEYMGNLCAIESEFRGSKISKRNAEELFCGNSISVIYMDSAKYKHKVTLDVDFAEYDIPIFYSKKIVQIPKLRFLILKNDILRDMSIYNISNESTSDVKLDFSLKGLDESIHNTILKDLHKNESFVKKEDNKFEFKNVNDLDVLDFNPYIDDEIVEDDDDYYDDIMDDVDNLELTDNADLNDEFVQQHNNDDDDDVPFE